MTMFVSTTSAHYVMSGGAHRPNSPRPSHRPSPRHSPRGSPGHTPPRRGSQSSPHSHHGQHYHHQHGQHHTMLAPGSHHHQHHQSRPTHRRAHSSHDIGGLCLWFPEFLVVSNLWNGQIQLIQISKGYIYNEVASYTNYVINCIGYKLKFHIKRSLKTSFQQSFSLSSKVK